MMCPTCSGGAASPRIDTGPPGVRCGKLPGVGGTYAGPCDMAIAAWRLSDLTTPLATRRQRRSNVLDRRALRRRWRRIIAAAIYRLRSSSRCSAPNRFDTSRGTRKTGGPLTRPAVDGGRGGAVKGVGAPTGATTVEECTPSADVSLSIPSVVAPPSASRLSGSPSRSPAPPTSASKLSGSPPLSPALPAGSSAPSGTARKPAASKRRPRTKSAGCPPVVRL